MKKILILLSLLTLITFTGCFSTESNNNYTDNISVKENIVDNGLKMDSIDRPETQKRAIFYNSSIFAIYSDVWNWGGEIVYNNPSYKLPAGTNDFYVQVYVQGVFTGSLNNLIVKRDNLIINNLVRDVMTEIWIDPDYPTTQLGTIFYLRLNKSDYVNGNFIVYPKYHEEGTDSIYIY